MTQDIPMSWFLYLSAALFCIGLFGVLTRRNAIAVLLAIELMLNAANLNFVVFWRYAPASNGLDAPAISGVMMAIFVITIAAAEVAVGIGLILLCYRQWKAADVDRYNTMAG